MVQYQRLIIHHGRKEDKSRASIEDGGCYSKRAKQKFRSLLFLSLLSCCFIFCPYLFGFSTLSLLDSLSRESQLLGSGEPFVEPLCSQVSNGTICCDRTGLRSDICVMKGDIRTNSLSSSIFLFTNNTSTNPEKIKPYTRKWETSVMNTVQQLNLITKDSNNSSDRGGVCDVYHDVSAVFFSTGGYTGNVYHEFNDGIIPLFITSQHFNKKVVFVIVEYHDWWEMKYGDVVSQLSDYPLVDFNGDSRTHCFQEAIVGLRIHDELTVNSSLMVNGDQTIVDFRNVLDRGYTPRIQSLIQEENETTTSLVDFKKKPKMVILSRNGSSRAILNENQLVKLAEEIGFNVEVLRPEKTTELPKIYRSMNTSDVMIGVHGAAMTHFLFLRPKTVFIQIVPLGTEWAAETYYGEPAKKLGLKYIGYKISPKESSLYEEYGKDSPVIRDPDSLNDKGWEYTKKIYLQGQNVKLDLRRFRETLTRSYDFSIRRRVREEVPRLLAA